MGKVVPLDLPKPVPTVMPFGKYKDKTFEDVPSDYIQWALGEDMDKDLKHELKLEWNSRDKWGEHFYSEDYE